jgi:hypothetical protein
MRFFAVSALLALAAPAVLGAAVRQLGNSDTCPCPARDNLGSTPTRTADNGEEYTCAYTGGSCTYLIVRPCPAVRFCASR